MKVLVYPSLLLTCLALSAGCSREHSAAERTALLPAVAVRQTTVQSERVPLYAEATGSITPLRRALVSPKLMGVIAEFPVVLGQSVQAGELLAVLHAGEVQARLAQAKAQLNLSLRDLERERTLLSKDAGTPDMVRSLEDRVRMDEATVHEAEVMLAYARILAPFDGVVARKSADAGDLATPGIPILELEGRDAFLVEARIPDSVAQNVKVGTRVQVELPDVSEVFEAQVAELAPSSDSQARNALARIRVPSERSVRSGQFVRVRLEQGLVSMLLIPRSSVSHFGQMDRVFVAREKRAVLRLVKTGAVRGDRVEILSGLEAGEAILVEPPANLVEGQSLEVRL